MWVIILILKILEVCAQVSENDVQYFLWNSRTSHEKLSIDNYGNNFIETGVKIFIHGWGDSANSFWYPDARNNYLSLGYNVICVDWSKNSILPYSIASIRLNDMASYIAKFIVGLSNNKTISLNKFHIIGDSLGSHLSGFSGKNIQTLTGGKVGRITGLDPAGPGFTLVSSNERLNKDNANHVDVIHTDAGNLGIYLDVGHVDFWVNGGTAIQPGCFYPLCSHTRAPLYFIEGILSDKFVSRNCTSFVSYRAGLCDSNSKNLLGEKVDFTNSGNFYLNTNGRSPYARG